MRKKLYSILAGLAAGAVNGLLGAGGGMVLVPILSAGSDLEEKEIFVSLLANSGGDLPWAQSWPYLLGAIPGGLLAGFFGRKIPVNWLHRGLGAMIIYGGIRYLC